ncbi:hypothetical protein MtrunA17_Chr1g0169231 [Medicago truncatula]|uniref:Transmembrane protein n=1 Tax=Medicago truncatula TaxID=3880 RepID=A0A396JRB0_MEDTR|nr:hypothetical protein MtrunA17_Chr1g0169231 [Medicago truncatula]
MFILPMFFIFIFPFPAQFFFSSLTPKNHDTIITFLFLINFLLELSSSFSKSNLTQYISNRNPFFIFHSWSFLSTKHN